jgi:hypothetical protein
MQSGIVPKLDGLLKSFTYWAVEIIADPDKEGQVAIRCLREGVRRTGHLNRQERTELFDEIVPRVERMAGVVLGNERGTYQWRFNAYCFIPEKVDRSSADLCAEYHRALNAAAA